LTTQHYFVVRHDIDEDIYETADRGVITFSLSMLILGADVVFTSLLSP
jgi:putative membrane protein